MRKVLLACLLMLVTVQGFAVSKGIQVISNEAQRRVDITIDGEPFTAYVWPTQLKKPVLFPLTAAGGIEVTRGYPLASKAGERTDHPHHAGMWFNYGNVNGFDFWNNSDAIKPEARAKMGAIQHQKIVSTKSGMNRAELVVESVWVNGEGKPIIDETTQYVFARKGNLRSIDRITTLHPLEKIVFHDDKEGVLGIRVARWLESLNEKGGTFTDANGVATKVEGQSGAGATGEYLTSEGKRGDAVWGTRGRWCLLTGHTGNNTVTVAILDHARNPGYPTYWHARGYGLFAANPLGRKIFDPQAPAFDFTIEKDQTTVFRHRVLLYPQSVTSEEMNRQADMFNAEYH